MDQLITTESVRAWRQQFGNQAVAFVPTMGALHQGHVSLIRRAHELAPKVVVSIFVNPTQFDEADDLAHYPRPLAEDLAICAEAKVDAVFLPEVSEFYPNGYCTFVEVVGPLTDKLCGAARPGHFRAVTTVVTKLFNIVQPQFAVFGEKDLQQALIIQRMVSDLCQPVEIVLAHTVRQEDGLPLSSRNQRLSRAARAKATALPRGLEKANRAFKGGEQQVVNLLEIVYEELLVHPGVEVDYADVVRIRGFEEVTTAEAGDVLAVATFIDGVRLIDHLFLGGPALPVDVDAEV